MGRYPKGSISSRYPKSEGSFLWPAIQYEPDRSEAMPVDWNEVNRWAQIYSEEVMPRGEYWSEEAEVPAPWIEEKTCEFCGKYFEACRPTQTVCSRACQSGRDTASWNDQAIVWLSAYEAGLSLDKIAAAAGVGKATVHKILSFHGYTPRDKRRSLKYSGSDFE